MYGRPSKSERANLGDPYRVYNEIQNVGKTVEGSKKRVRWVFGFTESNEEFEVTLTHSMVSGKRTIKENGREIVSSSNVMATDFSYGWDSPNTHRLFRIEAQSNVTVENDYIFTIDGIRFSDLPPKPVAGGRKSTTETNSRYGNEVNNVKRSSVGETTTAQPQQRSSVNTRHAFQSPPAAKSRSSDDFDPFESNNNNKSGTFDPFGNTTSTGAHNGGGFDPFSNNTPPSNDTRSRPAQNNTQNKSAAKSIFDSVEDETPANTSSFDAFGDNDPFNHQPTNTNANSDFGFDAFGEGNKKPTPVKAVAPPPVQPIQKKPVNNPTPDFFSQPVANNPPAQSGRRASAVEISMDFAGLSFESKSTGAPVQAQLAQQPRDVPKAAEPEPPKEEETVDPWASNLVDLDLSGRSTAQRRSSLQATGGPSLNQMMGNTNQRRSSVNPNDPFGAPDILPLNNPIPPAQPIRPLNPSQAISSLGPPAAPYGVPPPVGYGAPAPAPGYGAGRSSMTMPPAYGSGGAPPAMQNTRGSFIGGVPGVTPQGYGQPAKSSLDTLDWRS